jgi:hypothetical protein
MDSSRLSDWLQVFGLFGVMASLVFVGLQMKQDYEIALAETYSTRTAISVGNISDQIGSPQYLSATAKLYSGLREDLTAEEYVVMESALSAFLTIMENLHYQYRFGFLPEAHWQKNLAEIECRMSEPFFQDLADDWQGRADFRAVLDEAIARGKKADRSCWVSYADEPWKYFNPVQPETEPTGMEPPGS